MLILSDQSKSALNDRLLFRLRVNNNDDALSCTCCRKNDTLLGKRSVSNNLFHAALLIERDVLADLIVSKAYLRVEVAAPDEKRG